MDWPIDRAAEKWRDEGGREERDVFTVLHYTYKGKGSGSEGLVVFSYRPQLTPEPGEANSAKHASKFSRKFV